MAESIRKDWSGGGSGAKFLGGERWYSHSGRKQWCQSRLSPHFQGCGQGNTFFNYLGTGIGVPEYGWISPSLSLTPLTIAYMTDDDGGVDYLSAFDISGNNAVLSGGGFVVIGMVVNYPDGIGAANSATIGLPQQWHPAKQPSKSFWKKYAAQLSCEASVAIADVGNMDDQGGIYAPTLALAAALGSKTPWVAVTGTVVFGAITLETAIDARQQCTWVWN